MKIDQITNAWIMMQTQTTSKEAIKFDCLNITQVKEIPDRAGKHAFQIKVNRMMKLIINSLYRNKEVYCSSSTFNPI